MSNEIRFTNGAAYERYMGHWSQLVGEQFLRWLAPAQGLRALDVGCGNGAFTELLAERVAATALFGIDPSAPQLEFARTRPALRGAQFDVGDAMNLPYADRSMDLAVMPLVIFFVPEPLQGVREMARVVRASGWVAAYAWDMLGGGFPYEVLLAELRQLGHAVPTPPSPEASQIEVMHKLWSSAGLVRIKTRKITVRRTFSDFEDFWVTVQGAPSVGALLAALPTAEYEALKARLRAKLPAARNGQITYSARANAVQGRVPKRRKN